MAKNNKVKDENENEQPRKVVIINGKVIPTSEIISFLKRVQIEDIEK